MFAGLFRENAVRALLLTRRNPRRRAPLWAQRQRSRGLLASVRGYPGFPVVLETYRHAMRDVFDLAGLERLLARIRAREVQVHDVDTATASPFARSLVFAYVAAYIYEQDAPLAERRAQALSLDRALLAELLGQSELRELIDADVLSEVERGLQRLDPERHATDPDGLHDLLRRLGDLDGDELAQRAAEAPQGWLLNLEAARRVARVKVAGSVRWLAVEDVALYRDALGVLPPAGLPDRLLLPVDGALAQLVARYARTHGPFESGALAARYGLTPAQVEPVLEALERAGSVLRGEIRPGGSRPEWCDAEVFRRLKGRTLARLRNQVAAVDAATYARFLPAWQGLDSVAPAADALEQAVTQLEGLALPWSALVGTLLPARVPGFQPEMLDLLAATGRVVWVGRGALGPGDGRVALYRRGTAPRLLPVAPPAPPGGAAHRAILEHLQRHGACFTTELEDAARGADARADGRVLEEALWDLVWAGGITNDTFQPLRSLGAGPRRHGRGAGIAGGRWSLVAPLHDPRIDATQRLLATAETLLERYGVVSREAVASEGIAGGFAPLYKVLRAMEEAGRVRRGYFVEGLGSAQFGHAGAVDRLRAVRVDDDTPDPERVPEVRTLAAVDPANPWGAVLPWPATGGNDRVRPRRVPGAWLLLVDGAPALYVAASGRHLLTFPGATPDPERSLAVALAALPRLPRAGRRGLLVVEKVDGEPVADSPRAPTLVAHGFVRDYRGMTLAPERRETPRAGGAAPGHHRARG
jgi:ATP-dependent Lhr-like helicase